MSDALFDIPETLSPRLKWMKRHDLHLDQSGADFVAWRGGKWGSMPTPLNSAKANTGDNALFELAVKMKLPLWNEEEG